MGKRAENFARAENFERNSGRSLPAAYRTFVNAYPGGPRVSDAGLGLEFRLSTAEELLSPYTLDGTGLTRPFFSAHILHLARLRDAGVLIFDGSAEPVSPERFEPMLTIGVGGYSTAWESNLRPTHLLVLDPADGSVRCVPTDPPVAVRRVADSFQKWIKAATRKPRKTTAKTGKATKAKGVKKTKPPTVTAVLAAFKRKNKLTLPPPYAKFLKTHDGVATIPGPGGEQWQLATLKELADPELGTAQTNDGQRIPAVRLTRAFADALKAEKGVKFVPVYGTKLKFTLARLKKGVCVGHCNGDPLFLDPSTKYSVWGYSRDGQYVAKLANNFAAFLSPPKAKAKKAPASRKAATKPRKPRAAAKPSADAVANPTPNPAANPAAKPAVKRPAKRSAKVQANAVATPSPSVTAVATPSLNPVAKPVAKRATKRSAKVSAKPAATTAPATPAAPTVPSAPPAPRTAKKRAA